METRQSEHVGEDGAAIRHPRSRVAVFGAPLRADFINESTVIDLGGSRSNA